MKYKGYIKISDYTYAGHTCFTNYLNIIYSYIMQSNSSPHSCMANTLFTDPSPNPRIELKHFYL